jgi:diacylglycerol kinase (ATP)
MPTLVLINPAAGRKLGPDRLTQLISGRFHKQTEPFEIRVPPTQTDWRTLVESAPAIGFDKLLVAGGDGSIHLSLQAIDFEKLSLGILPLGSGNDIYRAFEIPIKIDNALDNFFAGEERVDVGQTAGKYFLNTAGCGLDTWTVEIKETSTGIFSRNYVYLFFRTIRALKPLDFEINIDGTTYKRRGFWAIAANNRYIGGGMKIAPDADMRDGLLDVLIIGDVTKAEMILRMPQIFKGTHLTHPKIEVIRGRDIIIDSAQDMKCALDGDLHSCTPLNITVHPSLLHLRGKLPPR